MGRLPAGRPLLRVHPPSSMPLAIPSPVSTPSIAVSQWPQRASFPEQFGYINSPDTFIDFSFDDVLANTPSNSYHSTTSSWMPRSEDQGFQHPSWPEEDLQSSFTAPSSFEMATQYLSNPASFTSAPMAVPHAQPHQELDILGGLQQFEDLYEKRSQLAIPLPGANVSSWAQGAYNVLDRTDFGSLAQPAAPPGLRRRRASYSRAGSSTSLSCESCGRLFTSRSERE